MAEVQPPSAPPAEPAPAADPSGFPTPALGAYAEVRAAPAAPPSRAGGATASRSSMEHPPRGGAPRGAGRGGPGPALPGG